MAVHSIENSERKLIATGGDSGTRADVFVARALNVSRARAQKILEGATINDASIKPSHVLKEDEEIILQREMLNETRPQKTASLEPQAEKLPPILFEDEELIIVNKPRGVVVHAGAGETGSTLVELLQAAGKKLSSVGPPERSGIVHRLDKDTSGVLVVCKSDAAHWKLAEDFASRRVTKEYAALVCGVPRAPGRVEAPIARHPVHRKKMAIDAAGRPATTEYSVVKSWPKFALLKVNILTGRTHQIRVHLQYLNFPVVGDATYGGLKRALENAPNDEVKTVIENLNGQALHAARLEFLHPISGEVLSFAASLPDDFQAVINALESL